MPTLVVNLPFHIGEVRIHSSHAVAMVNGNDCVLEHLKFLTHAHANSRLSFSCFASLPKQFLDIRQR